MLVIILFASQQRRRQLSIVGGRRAVIVGIKLSQTSRIGKCHEIFKSKTNGSSNMHGDRQVGVVCISSPLWSLTPYTKSNCCILLYSTVELLVQVMYSINFKSELCLHALSGL